MKLPRGSRTNGTNPAVVATIVAVVTLAVAVGFVGGASAQSSNTTTIDSCTTIDSPGTYVLTSDIQNSSVGENSPCIGITSGDVTLDGAGHTVTGGAQGYGVGVNGTQNDVTNVTVERLAASDWEVGVRYLNANNGTIRDTVTNDSINGISLAGASSNRLVNDTGYGNSLGIAIGGTSHNNTVRDATEVDNKWGIHFERESGGNTVYNSVARNNSRWDYYGMRNQQLNTVHNLSTATATVSFTERNLALASNASPPALPSGTGNLNAFIETARTAGDDPQFSLTMDYDSSNGSGTLYFAGDNGQWSEVDGASANDSAVSADDLTQFGTYGALSDSGEGGNVTPATSQPPTVQRTLTPVPGAPTATSTGNNGSANASSTMAQSTSSGAGATTAAGGAATSSGGAATAGSADNGSTSGVSGNVSGGSNGSGGSTSSNGPGFGLVAALVALVAAALVALRRRN